MTTKDLKAVLERVIERSASQKETRIANMRAELADLGLSVVTTEWLNAVIREEPLAGVMKVDA